MRLEPLSILGATVLFLLVGTASAVGGQEEPVDMSAVADELKLFTHYDLEDGHWIVGVATVVVADYCGSAPPGATGSHTNYSLSIHETWYGESRGALSVFTTWGICRDDNGTVLQFTAMEHSEHELLVEGDVILFVASDRFYQPSPSADRPEASWFLVSALVYEGAAYDPEHVSGGLARASRIKELGSLVADVDAGEGGVAEAIMRMRRHDAQGGVPMLQLRVALSDWVETNRTKE